MQHHNNAVNKLPGEVSLANTEQYILKSEIVDESYKILVASPPDWIAKQESYPVLYLLDANQAFLATTEIVRLLQASQELPPMLIVGIGYEEGDIGTLANRRSQEFTPTADPAYTGLWGLAAKGGDAGKFLNFINSELKPFLESQ
jgi:ferri-bacillibactin esterase